MSSKELEKKRNYMKKKKKKGNLREIKLRRQRVMT